VPRDVAGKELRLARSGGRDARGDGFTKLPLEPAEHDVGARFGEDLDTAFSDALRPARDRHRPSGKSHRSPDTQ